MKSEQLPQSEEVKYTHVLVAGKRAKYTKIEGIIGKSFLLLDGTTSDEPLPETIWRQEIYDGVASTGFSALKSQVKYLCKRAGGTLQQSMSPQEIKANPTNVLQYWLDGIDIRKTILRRVPGGTKVTNVTALEGSKDPEEEFKRYVREHSGALYSTAYRILGDALDAEDAVQDALLSAHRGIRQFDGQNLGGWLYQITVNRALDIGRKHARLQFINGEDADIMLRLNTSVGKTAQEEFQKRKTKSDVLTFINSLPPEHKDIVIMRYFQELPYATMARLTGLTIPAIKARVHRARVFLKDSEEFREMFEELD